MRIGRVIGVLAGVVVILGVGLYGPATLLGPLPSVTATELEPETDGTTSPPVLPDDGASALTEAADSAPFAVAGDEDALPMAGIAKVITALVVLDARPIEQDADTDEADADALQGEDVPITSDDFTLVADYQARGARTVTVYTADEWTQFSVMQAMLLGSANNLADTYAGWAFGSVDDYVSAAADWLAENGLDDTVVVDATGLSTDDVSTASDLSRLAALAYAEPVIAAVLSSTVEGIAADRGVENTTAYKADDGYTSISLSYTSQAGLCFLFAGTVSTDAGDYTFYGALVRMPDWDTLDAATDALMQSAVDGVVSAPVIEEGTAVVRFTSAWGDTADGVVGNVPERLRWSTATPVFTVDVDDFSTGTGGTIVGTLTTSSDGEQLEIPVRLSRSLIEPDVFWRLGHPFTLIPAFIGQFTAD